MCVSQYLETWELNVWNAFTLKHSVWSSIWCECSVCGIWTLRFLYHTWKKLLHAASEEHDWVLWGLRQRHHTEAALEVQLLLCWDKGSSFYQRSSKEFKERERKCKHMCPGQFILTMFTRHPGRLWTDMFWEFPTGNLILRCMGSRLWLQLIRIGGLNLPPRLCFFNLTSSWGSAICPQGKHV